MTKDNWIKAFDEKFANTLNEDGLSIWLNCPTPEYMKAFISQVENDAIEKTNKRWNNRIKIRIGQRKAWAKKYNDDEVTKIYEQQMFTLSDLLNDKGE